MKRCILPLILAAALLLSLCACAPEAEPPYPLSAQRIQADTEYMCYDIGPRPTGTDKEVECADWLQQQLEAMGFSTQDGTLVRTAFDGFPGMTSENLVATCNPDSDGPILCVMAHYDTVEGCPGARDNTAAVAVLLEFARYLGTQREDLNAQVRLLFLGSEENGYHGASAYVESLSQEELERHLVGINMENSAASPGEGGHMMFGTMGGWADGEYQAGNFLEPAENLATRAVNAAYARLYQGQALPAFQMGGSDHRIFHNFQIDAANVCWKYLENDKVKMHEHYHKASDTPENMDFDSAVVLGCCVLDALYLIADGSVV